MMKNELFPRIHISYQVSNLDSTIAFYSKFFEKEPVKVKEGYAKYILEEPSLNISFIENKDGVQPHTAHFGIEVNDPELLKQKLGNAMHHQLPIDEEKEVQCCYAKQDKFWVTDPDGYRWEVYQFLEDSEILSDKEETACCTS